MAALKTLKKLSADSVTALSRPLLMEQHWHSNDVCFDIITVPGGDFFSFSGSKILIHEKKKTKQKTKKGARTQGSLEILRKHSPFFFICLINF